MRVSGEQASFVHEHHTTIKRFGDGGHQYTKTTAVDSASNVLLAGEFDGTVYFGGGPLTSTSHYSIFVAKFDAQGDHLWSKRFGGSPYDYPPATVVDGVGNVLLMGYFTGTMDCGNGPRTSAGNVDIFLAKLRP